MVIPRYLKLINGATILSPIQTVNPAGAHLGPAEKVTTLVFLRLFSSRRWRSTSRMRVRQCVNQTADGQMTARLLAKAMIQTEARRKGKVAWDGKAGGGNKTQMNVMTKLNRNTDSTKPSSSPANV